MKSFSLWLVENATPSMLYHHSHPTKRQSIQTKGLLAQFDTTGDDNSIKGVYLIDHPSHKPDTWEVDVRELEIEEDFSWGYTGAEGNSYVFYGDIPTQRLKLIA